MWKNLSMNRLRRDAMKVGDGGSEAIETQLLGSTEGLEVVVRSEPEISSLDRRASCRERV